MPSPRDREYYAPALDAYEGQLRPASIITRATTEAELRALQTYIEGVLADVRVRLALLNKR